MNQIVTTGIVLKRINYQEADRILTLITPDHGKVRAVARGVRHARAKLAGGIELLSISEIGFIRGRGELATLTTARLKVHFGNIVKNLERTNLAFELMKRLDKITEDNAGPEYFELLVQSLQALDDQTTDLDLLRLWVDMQLLHISGHAPNLSTDTAGKPLDADGHYQFSFDSMAFTMHPAGPFDAGHIKLLRLGATQPIQKLQQLTGAQNYLVDAANLASQARKQILHA